MSADAASGGTGRNGEFDLDMYDDGYPGVDPTDHLYFYYHSYSAEPDNGLVTRLLGSIQTSMLCWMRPTRWMRTSAGSCSARWRVPRC